MTGIIVSILLGGLIGFFFETSFLTKNSGLFIDIGLCLILFFVGIELGDGSNLFYKLKKYGKKIWFLPISTVIGSIIGGIISALVLKIAIGEGVAIAVGLGWYSLTSVELSKINAELGSLSFLANVFRELLSILFIPYISKKIGGFESVSTAGATAMDSLLPIINKHNDKDISVVAFFSGVVLTTLIPILLQLTIVIFKIK